MSERSSALKEKEAGDYKGWEPVPSAARERGLLLLHLNAPADKTAAPAAEIMNSWRGPNRTARASNSGLLLRPTPTLALERAGI